MEHNISTFTNLTRKSNSHFSVLVEKYDAPSEMVEFEAPRNIEFGTDLIAHALITLIPRHHKDAFFDFAVSNACLERIRSNTGLSVSSSATCEEETWRAREGKVVISFSGGFDSLAVLALAPRDSSLVTMDFGGRFSRERKIYDRFSTTKFATNLVETNLRSASWTFMGIGAILSMKSTAAKYLTFGGIMDGSAEAFQIPSPLERNPTHPVFKAAGFVAAPYAIGITEVATAIIIAKKFPDIALESLSSLAPEVSEKMVRKNLILLSAKKNHGVSLDLPAPSYPKSAPKEFSKSSMSGDVLSFWFIKNFGAEVARKMVANIPEEVSEIAGTRPLTLYERYNPNCYKSFPTELSPGLFKALKTCGIEEYAQQDFEDLNLIGDILGKFKNIKGRTKVQEPTGVL